MAVHAETARFQDRGPAKSRRLVAAEDASQSAECRRQGSTASSRRRDASGGRMDFGATSPVAERTTIVLGRSWPRLHRHPLMTTIRLRNDEYGQPPIALIDLAGPSPSFHPCGERWWPRGNAALNDVVTSSDAIQLRPLCLVSCRPMLLGSIDAAAENSFG